MVNAMNRFDFSNSKTAVIGAGKMGGILIKALLEKELLSPELLRATVQHSERVHGLADQFPIQVSTDNQAAVQDADVVLVCVKPPTVREVIQQIGPHLTESQLLISIAASVPTSQIEHALKKGVPVMRAMPNTPCASGVGMTALCKGRYASTEHIKKACALFDVVGRTIVVDEKHMDAVTALSASGPAYIYIILESLAEAGVKLGLPRDMSTLLAAQTTLGAATVILETGHHPALLKDAVTTPAGCTIDGILELEEGKLRVTLIKAVVKAAQRLREMTAG